MNVVLILLVAELFLLFELELSIGELPLKIFGFYFAPLATLLFLLFESELSISELSLKIFEFYFAPLATLLFLLLELKPFNT